MIQHNLVYTKDYQINLVTHLVLDEKFFKKAVIAQLKVSDFDLPACQFVFAGLTSYVKKYNAFPHYETLFIYLEQCLGLPGSLPVALRPEEFISLATVLQQIVEMVKRDKLDTEFYSERLADYVQTVRLAQIHGEFETGGFTNGGGTQDYIVSVSKLNQEVSRFGNRPVIDTMLGNPETPTVETIVERVPTALAVLNNLTSGGLGLGEIGMITACPGVGKTTALLNFMNTAIQFGHRALFITLELLGKRIKHRFQAIAGGVDSRVFKIPFEQWPQEMKDRYASIIQPDYKFRDYSAIVDCSLEPITLSVVDNIIADWKAHYDEQYAGKTGVPRCTAVYLDWLDMMAFGGLDVYAGFNTKSKDQKDHDLLTKMVYGLGRIAKKHNVALWTATQGNKSADGVEVLKMSHVAGAWLKNAGLDLSIGLAPIMIEDNEIKSVIKNDDDMLAPPCDRELMGSIMKNRDNVSDRSFRFYQGSTLKFHTSKSDAMYELSLGSTTIKRMQVPDASSVGASIT